MKKTTTAGPKIPPFQSGSRVVRRATAVAAAVLLAAIGSVFVAAPAQAAAWGPTHCYQWPTERIAATNAGPGGVHYTNQIMVTDGSPCHDVNVRAVTADGAPTCRMMRVRWGSEAGISTGPWTRVCTGWKVLWNNADEGDVFVLEVAGALANVGERT